MSGRALRHVPPRLVLLTDRTQLPAGRSLPATVRACAAAGLGAVVVREHDLPGPARSRLVAALAALPGLLVLSSRLEDHGADGRHLAAGQPPPDPGDGRPWGRSCHDPDALRRAADEGASWATLSPWRATPSKPGHGPPVPRAWYAASPLPVLALGGVAPGEAAAARAAGAHGVAVMGAVMRAAEPAAVVAALLEEVA